MKKAMTLLLALLLCMTSAVCEPLRTLPPFTEDYGANEFYLELEQAHGPFGLWPSDMQRWLSESLDRLIEQEQLRMDMWHSGQGVQMNFPRRALTHRYGTPEAGAIPRAEAEALARAWAEAHGTPIPDDVSVWSFYIVDDPSQPVWAFRFFDKTGTLTETNMHALTGEFPPTDAPAACRRAREYLLAASVTVGQDLLDADLLAQFYSFQRFDFARREWLVSFKEDNRSVEFIIAVDENADRINSLESYNG